MPSTLRILSFLQEIERLLDLHHKKGTRDKMDRKVFLMLLMLTKNNQTKTFNQRKTLMKLDLFRKMFREFLHSSFDITDDIIMDRLMT